MKDITTYIEEKLLEDFVWTVYMGNDTSFNFFDTEEKANECCKQLNKENKDAGAYVKKEKKSSIISKD